MSCECALRAARAGRRLGARRGGSSGTHRASSPCLACPPTTAPKPPARYVSTRGQIPYACLSLAPNAAQRTHALQPVWLHAQLGCRLCLQPPRGSAPLSPRTHTLATTVGSLA